MTSTPSVPESGILRGGVFSDKANRDVDVPDRDKFGLLGLYRVEPSRARPRVSHGRLYIISSRRRRLGGFCLVEFSFQKLEFIVVSVATSPYTVIQGPCSYSPRLCRLVLSNRVFEPLYCNFRLRVYPFLLAFSIRLQEKPYWRGQSSCAWLITNGAVV